MGGSRPHSAEWGHPSRSRKTSATWSLPLWALVVLFSHGFRGFNSGLRSSCLQGQHCTDGAISPIHTHDSWSYIDFVQILAVMLFQMKYLDSFHSNFLICHLGQKKKGIYFQQIFIYKEYENMIYRLNLVLGLNYKPLTFPSDSTFSARDP